MIACQVCGYPEEEFEEEDYRLCAGCGKRGCGDCVFFRAPEYDPPNGEYFCDDCNIKTEEEDVD